MPGTLRHLNRTLGRAFSNAKLLKSDPERFARNLLQFTNPTLFEQRLVDVAHATPMHIRYEANSARVPTLNILDTAWSVMGMTGGPNTVINLACRVARQGVAVRLVSTVGTTTIDPNWLHGHAESLLGGGEVPSLQIASAGRASQPLQVGPGDVFLATHWTTAQQLKPVLSQIPCRQFFYMLQEFEPGFYACSSNFALAVETYGLD